MPPRIVALLKPGEGPNVAKIVLLCQTYEITERMILNRLSQHIDRILINEQAGLRP
jgi:hypothetical protein